MSTGAIDPGAVAITNHAAGIDDAQPSFAKLWNI
jgi:hypothetical protein